MNNSATRNDAMGLNDMECNDVINKQKTTTESYMEGVHENANKSSAFVNDGQTTTTVNTANGLDVSGRIADGRNIKSEFNIKGGSIGQAAIGNTGPVSFNQTQRTYQKGSSNTNFKISGGNFNQSSLGGKATYNNQNSKISAGGSGGGGGSFFTPEQLTLHILQRGLTKKQFIELLEKKYSLVNLAFALPKKAEQRDQMVEALLAVSNN